MATPFERVKVAWDSPDRAVELNRVVEAMAGEGVARDELDDSLGKLLDEVRAAGADDDTEEVINNVGDRLHGWCHPSGHIKVRATRPPHDEEVAKLPRWARVAFAARCTRRLLPLLTAPSAAEPRGQVVEAVKAIEQAASMGDPDQVADAWANALIASKSFRDLNLGVQAAVADAVYRAALFASAGGSIRVASPDVIYKAVGTPVWTLVADIAKEVGSDISGDLRRDYDLLSQIAAEQHWADDTPVPPTVFDPSLWPNGPPFSWSPEVATGLG